MPRFRQPTKWGGSTVGERMGKAGASVLADGPRTVADDMIEAILPSVTTRAISAELRTSSFWYANFRTSFNRFHRDIE